MTMISRLSLLLAALALTASAGCTVQRMSFPGHDPEQVWTAMVAVAQTPDYGHEDYTKRWTVRANEVWIDPDRSRIEVYRRLERILHRPASRPLHERREWKFSIAMEADDPPTVTFVSRSAAIPAHVWDEAQRYFDEVWQVLGGKPLAPAFRRQPAPAVEDVEPAQPESERPAPRTIDIESLEPKS